MNVLMDDSFGVLENGVSLYLPSEVSVAQQIERIAALEKDKQWHWVGLTVLAFVGVGWLTWCSVTLMSIKGDIQAVKQKIKDGGLGDIVSSIQTPTSPQQLSASLDLLASTLQMERIHGTKPNPVKLEELSAVVKDAAEKNPDLSPAWRAAFQKHRSRDDCDWKDDHVSCRGMLSQPRRNRAFLADSGG